MPRRVGDGVAHLAALDRTSDIYVAETLIRSLNHK
jgi:hypothetical protein